MSKCKCAISLTGKPWAIDFIRSNIDEIINEQFDACGRLEIIDPKKVYEDSNCDDLEISILFHYESRDISKSSNELPENAMYALESIPGINGLLAQSRNDHSYCIWSEGESFETHYHGSGLFLNNYLCDDDDMFEQTSKNKGSSS